jgi:putative selenium metabolism hydrolase
MELLELFMKASTWLSLITLTVMEIVLGIDNVIFISLVTGRLPKVKQNKARKLGLFFALFIRIILLAFISYIVNELKIKPEFVVITEPTSLNIYRGHRGRMEIKVSVAGVSCHGSAPERGDNAIFKMAPILLELEQLHPKLLNNDFLGKGSLTVSEIFFSSPSRCAVADGCSVSIDRRLTDGETFESALEEIRNLPSVKKVNATVEMYDYDRPSYTGLVYPTKSYFPTWVLPADHVVCESTVKAYEGLFNKKPLVDKWTFSTNAVSIMGRYNIPCIGFGPGHEEEAHAPNEKTWISELVKASAMYASIPLAYLETLKEKK